MNITVIALGIVVIVLLYFLFKMVYSQYTNATKIYLKDGTKSVNTTDLKNAGSTRYNYATWMYVNTWSNTRTKSIISRKSQIAPGSSYTTTTPDFMLWLDTTSPALKCFFAKNGSTTTPPATPNMPSITITNNFPIQKWVYVIISVDNQIVDCYIDGKLTISSKLSDPPMISTEPIMFGDGGNPDIYLVSPIRTPSPMDPQTAWNNYLGGNGMGSTNTNIKMSYIQDNIEKKYFSIPM